MNKQSTYKNAEIRALGHAGFMIKIEEKNLSFAFDPYDIKEEEPLDFIFVTHHHFDHCDPVSIRKLTGPKTKIVAPTCCKNELAEFGEQLVLIDDKEKHSDGDIIYWCVPAYNIDKFRTPNEVFHPIEMGGVGFVVEIDRTRFYHAGDTDKIPEMEKLKKIDVAFLPISGTFVMTAQEAIEAAKVINPKAVVPMHYGKLLGSVGEATRFYNLLNNEIPVMVVTDAHYH